MGELYGWIAGAAGIFIAVIAAWFTGHARGESKAEQKATEQRTREMIEATTVAAKRETTVSREAAHVDQTVNNSSNTDVDKQLLDKWTRK